MSRNDKFSGVITALVTPFKNGEVDFESFKRILRQQLDAGVDGFVVNGTTGESPTLHFGEVRALFETARGECGPGKTLILGTGSNSTQKAIELTEATNDWGQDANLVVVPYYNRPPQRGLIRHFEAIANVSRAPILLYNVPSRTVAALEPATVVALHRNHSNVVGIKEASGNLATLAAIIQGVSSDFALLSGDDASAVDFCANGGHGVIAVASHIIASEMRGALTRAREGNARTAADYRRAYQNLFRWLYVEANPIPVKAALNMMGLIDSPELRPPLDQLDNKFAKDLETCLVELGKL